MPTIKMPTTGVVGLDNEARLEKSRAFRMDFDPNKFVDQIEIKGYRLAWSRAAECPCAPINKQTDQPDPNCSLCKGRGAIYFRPIDYVLNEDRVGSLDPVQTVIAKADDAVVIRGIMTGLQFKTDRNDKVGRWVDGMSTVTVRPENKVGYYDRLTNLDGKQPFAETVILKKGERKVKTRYPVIAVNLLRSFTTVFKAEDFEIDKGTIMLAALKAPTATETRISVHYLMHPTWLIVDHPNSFREQYIQKKLKRADLETPIGNNAELPIRATLQLDYLPTDPRPKT